MSAPFRRTLPVATRANVPTIAPAPTDDSRRPRPSGPTWRMSRAKIVTRALLCPNTESAASVARMSGSTGLLSAYWMPPHAARPNETRAPVAEVNFVRIASRAKIDREVARGVHEERAGRSDGRDEDAGDRRTEEGRQP